MLLSHRETQMDRLDARVDTHAVIHTGYRIHVVERRNVVSEDALYLRAFDRVGYLARPTLTVLLEGRARIRAHGKERWLGAGDVSVIGTKGAIEMRQDGPKYLSLVVEWDPGRLSSRHPDGFSTGKLGEPDLASLREAARQLSRHDVDVDTAAATVSNILAILHATGAELDPAPPAALIESVTPAMRGVGRALDHALSHLGGRPMCVDLESALGVCSRHVNRLVTEYNRRYGFNSSGWRDTRNRRQLLMGATLMTAPGALCEEVAEAVGYGSARSFGRALADAGLPSPSAIAGAVRALE